MFRLRSWCAVWIAVLVSFSTGRQLEAEVFELPLNADRCAIYYALTLKEAPGCAGRDMGFYGPPRRLPATTEFSRDAEPLKSLEEENGYFVRFAFNSNELNSDYQSHLDRLSVVLTSPLLADSCIKLIGHTDSVGAAVYNKGLSNSRVQKVAAYLTGQGGLAVERIATEARGESQTLPGIPGSHPRNRRVEMLAKERSEGVCN